jgi:hypothetical protein
VADASFSQIGETGTGRLRLRDALGVEEMPWSIRRDGAWGVTIAYVVAGARVTVRDTSRDGDLHAVLTLDRERLIGRLGDGDTPVSIVLTRVSW